MSSELTLKQLACVNAVLKGDIFLLGEAETEKSKLVSGVCKRRGSDIQVFCSMGVVCEVFKGDSNLAYLAVKGHSS